MVEPSRGEKQERIRIILVEDDPDLGKMLKRFFETQNVELHWETDGRSALSRFKTSNPPPHIVLTDINLPGIDGYQLLQEIRRIDPQVPVIFLTGDDQIKSKKDSTVPPDLILNKPVRLAQLEAIIAKFGKKKQITHY
ncbi:hypothetical protein CEE37_01160 [candidate division LCP-89 bacterium B3_LCP]|uniref:Response regulatory domain-containing protein n=1 Tax=candidate division LCP-89 bacterium B3_LCP TaxID=2012998 RepID=A0A532V561_UNCL8|nr:MAG: hypothetical protein CEE37_01160 [candidate division LCP-89 bacterium B3_LCP]